MDYKKFRDLISKEETNNIDRKLKCKAFEHNNLVANAELAKDICAMANNGNVASYILIGISDDGVHFESVTNMQISEQNVQDLCKNAIWPPPRIRFHELCWKGNRINEKHRGKRFIVIQVGPNPKKPYRLNRDYISYKEKVCLRKNNVWIRRGSISDLATPEEIGYLLKIKTDLQVTTPSQNNNQEYLKILRSDRVKVLRSDLLDLFDELGWKINDNDILHLKIRDENLIYKCVIRDSKIGTYPWNLNRLIDETWKQEHGVIVINIQNITKAAFKVWDPVHYKETWGWFALCEKICWENYGHMTREDDVQKILLSTLVLSNVSSTTILRKNILDLVSYIESNDSSFEMLLESKKQVERCKQLKK
jgi:schlafen family protein